MCILKHSHPVTLRGMHVPSLDKAQRLHHCVKYSSFATLILFLFYSPHPECPIVCQVGKAQGNCGWGRWGRTRGWDSGRAQWWGHHLQFWYYTLSLVLLIGINLCACTYVYIYIYILYFFLLLIPLLSLSPFYSWADESTDEEIVRPRTKEEEDVDTFT